MSARFIALALAGAFAMGSAQPGDNFSDTWVATDSLGRSLPVHAQVGDPRADRTVGLFYFLWLGAHIRGGPYDVTRILAQDPDAMSKPDSPLWGPLHAPHHWGESLFGHYRTDDPAVLRKHAQMLSDAGVDVVIFDVTNQVTYRDDYRALLREWAAMRELGNRTPQVAFLTPFWDPQKVVRELWTDLYSTGQYRDLWFLWDGKPLLLADPDLLLQRSGNSKQDHPAEIRPGHVLGQTFTTDQPLEAIAGRFPTWNTTQSAVTLTLHRTGTDPEVIVTRRFTEVADNQWLHLRLDPPLPPGTYHLTASEPAGKIGWWSHSEDSLKNGTATADGSPVAGDRTLHLMWSDTINTAVRDFFTFRKPQPDYFQGPTRPGMWSWLEVFPQHVFHNSRGEREQMSVGVAQNAVNGRLGSMSEPGARGRSFHGGRRDTRPDAVRLGLNFAEQAAHALNEDPRFVFVTGWNEWIAGRHAEFNGIRLPVMFVDQFDQEHSRDIEPMRGGHGDDYYHQFSDFVRRYKGVRPIPPLRSGDIRIDGEFSDWLGVQPEFRDTVGDPVRRHHRGWGEGVTHTNLTGRNDIVSAKASWSPSHAAFLVRTRDALTPATDPDWMILWIDSDSNPGTGWMGYDHRILAADSEPGQARVERFDASRTAWVMSGHARIGIGEREMELATPWASLGLDQPPAVLDFKWTDNTHRAGDWTDFTLNGDAAPNDRFNFRALARD
jgi:hypothetical protein